jgi:NitT/TauT family transport system ATP-binding protein
MSISLHNVTFSYKDKEICRDLSWQLPPRGILCLWGPSGCGKTTLLRLLAGLEHPSEGSRYFPEAGQVSFVFQEDRLLPWATALENVTLPGTEEALVSCLVSPGFSFDDWSLA